MAAPFDVILIGATGFTGGLVADYLAASSRLRPLRWALAGRNEIKLTAVRKRLAAQAAVVVPELRVMDLSDAAALRALVAQARVVITTVGPYDRLGEPVLRACAEAGTHYVDLTGEPQFVARMRERYDSVARQSGAKIVPSCGFEAIPPDIGALFTVNALRERLGEAAWAQARVSLRGGVEAGGGFSGGTWHSAVEAMGQAPRWWWRHRQQLAELGRRLPAWPYREARLGRWALPMPTIDPEVVRHSARLRGDYGAQFAYGHFYLAKQLLPALAGVAGLSAIFALAQLGPSRRWLLQQKRPGQGPTIRQREQGWFRISFVAEAAGQRLLTQVCGGDPGYGDTAKMLAEAALCLAQDSGLPARAGILTPASAMGEALIPRLQAAGLEFNILA